MQLTQNDPLKLGFIGGGLSSAIGAIHYSASRLDGHWELVTGTFSRNQNINFQTGHQWNVKKERIYGDWKDLILREKNNVDAFCVLTPTPSHVEALEELIINNVPIICEKSVTMDLSEIRKISTKIKKNNPFFVATFNYTGYPLIRELKQLIKEGILGNIQQIHIEMPQEGFVRPPEIAGKSAPPQSWRLKDGTIPTICLDLGVHLQSIVQFLTGQVPSETFAHFHNYSQYNGLIDYVKMLLKFESGMSGSFWMTKTAIGNRNGLDVRVFGDKASAHWHQLTPEELHINYINGRREIIDRGSECKIARQGRYSRMKAGHPAGFLEAFANYYADIASALRDYKKQGYWNSEYLFNIEHSESGLQLFEAAAISNKEKAWIKLKDL